jgi:hypothetical protein
MSAQEDSTHIVHMMAHIADDWCATVSAEDSRGIEQSISDASTNDRHPSSSPGHQLSTLSGLVGVCRVSDCQRNSFSSTGTSLDSQDLGLPWIVTLSSSTWVTILKGDPAVVEQLRQ